MSTLQQTQPRIVPAGTGHFADLGDHRGFVKISSRDTNNTFALFEMQADFKSGTPPHIHTREDETFYIQEGRFSFLVGEETVEVGPGDTLFAPRNIPHAWRCVSTEGGRALVLLTPGANFENFALEMSRLGIMPLDPDSVAKLVAIAEQFGIQILPPSK